MKKWWKSRTILVSIFVGILMAANIFADLLPGKVSTYVSGVYVLTVFMLRMLDIKLYKQIVLGRDAAETESKKRALPKKEATAVDKE
jgi:hypothetical protein